MPAGVQRNPYKGQPPRAFVRLTFAAADGSLHTREFLVGLPLLRLLEYGGDRDAFWIARPGAAPAKPTES